MSASAGLDSNTISRMTVNRALAGVALLAALAVVLWVILLGLAHPIGSLAYFYVVAFPSVILMLGLVAGVIVLVKFSRRH
jgi:hypothetical protein